MHTHSLNIIPKVRTNIIVTNHCADRVLQRFHLKLYSHEKESIHHIKGAVKDLIMNNGTIDRRFEFPPFYYNKCRSKYSETIVIKTKLCCFICKYDDSKLIVKTAVRKP